MTIENIQNLDALKSALESGITADWSDLPTFGGDAPDDTTEVWSWDAERVLVGTCADDLAIMDRNDEDGWWNA